MNTRDVVLYPMLDGPRCISRGSGAVRRTVMSRWALLCMAACLCASCGDSSDTESSASTGGDGASTGGSAATGGSGGSGGATAPAGGTGGTTASSSPGGSATGGTVSSSGGVAPTTGGSSSGGASAGGTGSGGMPTGGRGPAGGRTGTAGSATGGGATGGVGTGGDSAAGGITGTGGRARGGGTSGGAETGGSESGGAATGGGSTTGGAGGAASEDATIVPDPDWACGMADGIPAPAKGQLAFSITLQISATHDVGNTPYGHRRLLDVKGGTITGDKLKGSVVTGGLEYELTLSNGVVEFQGINILKTSDNALIFVRSCGVAPDESSTPRVIPDFEATTNGSYAFLNTGKFVATRVATAGSLQLDVYDVSTVTAGEPRVQITKPSGVAKQPWECNKTSGAQGPQVFTESVSLGSTMSIANAKYGSRNIIPITGGTTTGKVVGSILNGGADYQLSGSLDAWYTLAPSNGEFILVRNCGASGGLIPWFEARVDGEYDFLNANTYLSSPPGMAGGGVSITFYERQ